MRTFDFAPLYRSTVGFDRLAALLDQVSGPDTEASNFPPYNIERTAENAFRISMAVAGFARVWHQGWRRYRPPVLASRHRRPHVCAPFPVGRPRRSSRGSPGGWTVAY
jgi:hypothetical protein